MRIDDCPVALDCCFVDLSAEAPQPPYRLVSWASRIRASSMVRDLLAQATIAASMTIITSAANGPTRSILGSLTVSCCSGRVAF